MPPSPYSAISSQRSFGTWLIPVFIFGSLFCIAIIALIRLFFMYGCWCVRRSEDSRSSGSVLGKEDEGGTVRARPHIVLVPQYEEDYPRLQTPQSYQQGRSYGESPPQYEYQEPVYREEYLRTRHDVDIRSLQQCYQQAQHSFTHNQWQSQEVRPLPLYQRRPIYQIPGPNQSSHLLPSPPFSQRPVARSAIKYCYPSESEESIHLAYDHSLSLPTLFSQSSASNYPLDDILNSSHFNSFATEGPSVDIPRLKFTPPSVCSVDDLLQTADISISYGRAVPQSKSLPDIPRSKRKSRANRAVAIIGTNIVIDGANGSIKQESMPTHCFEDVPRSKRKSNRAVAIIGTDIVVDGSIKQESMPKRCLEDVVNKEAKKKRRQAGGIYTRDKENQDPRVAAVAQKIMEAGSARSSSRRRKSIVIKVWVASTSDLWKFWVSRNESLEEFRGRVWEKIGAEAVLSVNEDVPLTEEEWRSVPGGSRITAHVSVAFTSLVRDHFCRPGEESLSYH